MVNQIFNESCIETMNRMESNFLDCIITSPPYNVGIEYDEYEDSKTEEEYFNDMYNTFCLAYDKLKDDGRLALNIPMETGSIGNQENRVFLAGDFWRLLKDIGFQWGGFVRLVEDSPQVARRISQFGSWLSPSAPYICNSEECVLILYKNVWKKQNTGVSYFDDQKKREFIDLIKFGWKYKPDMNPLTKATFSLDLPLSALKILTWENDLVYDPFMGSGTTAIACHMLNRRWIGSEISKGYYKKASNRIKTCVDYKWSAKAFFEL
jgi:site-specific DNA-methyltransferase (adenine-specific)